MLVAHNRLQYSAQNFAHYNFEIRLQEHLNNDGETHYQSKNFPLILLVYPIFFGKY